MADKIKLQYKPNEPQKDFRNDVTTKFLHLSGGYGVGKSYALVMKAAHLGYLNLDIPGGCVVPSFADYKKDLLPAFEEIMDENRVNFRYHGGEHWYKFPWSRGKLYVVTAEKRIKGPNWGWAIVNEVTLLEKIRFQDTMARVRIKNTPYPQIASSGTPEGDDHWLYEMFVEKPLNSSRIIYGHTKQNAVNLGNDYIDTLTNAYDKTMQAAYLAGQFVNMTNQRFYYCHDTLRCHDRSIVQNKALQTHASIDYNVSPLCVTLWHIVPVLNAAGQTVVDRFRRAPMMRLRGYGQIQIDDNADAQKLADAMYYYGLHPDDTILYPDPAGSSRSTKGAPETEQLRLRGWHQIKVRLAAPRFRKRQLLANALMENGLITYNPDTCPGIDKDFRSVKRESDGSKVKDNPALTHYSDGFDYMIELLDEFKGFGERPAHSQSLKYR